MYHADLKYALPENAVLVFDTKFKIGPAEIWTTGSVRKYDFSTYRPYTGTVTLETRTENGTNGSILANQSFETLEEAKAFVEQYNVPLKVA